MGVYNKSIDTDEARRQLQLRGGAGKFAARAAGEGGDEVLRLYRIFRSIDLDGSGEADFDEVRQLLARSASSAISDGQFQEWMDQMDADGSGAVDFEEFLAVY